MFLDTVNFRIDCQSASRALENYHRPLGLQRTSISVPYDKVINSFPKSERQNAVVGWPHRWLYKNSEPRFLLEREQTWAVPSDGHTSDMYVLIGAKIDAGK
jgi:hypothetical protein